MYFNPSSGLALAHAGVITASSFNKFNFQIFTGDVWHRRQRTTNQCIHQQWQKQ